MRTEYSSSDAPFSSLQSRTAKLFARRNMLMLPDMTLNPPVRGTTPRPAYPNATCVGECEAAIDRVSDKTDTGYLQVGNTSRLGSTYL